MQPLPRSIPPQLRRSNVRGPIVGDLRAAYLDVAASEPPSVGLPDLDAAPVDALTSSLRELAAWCLGIVFAGCVAIIHRALS